MAFLCKGGTHGIIYRTGGRLVILLCTHYLRRALLTFLDAQLPFITTIYAFKGALVPTPYHLLLLLPKTTTGSSKFPLICLSILSHLPRRLLVHRIRYRHVHEMAWNESLLHPRARLYNLFQMICRTTTVHEVDAWRYCSLIFQHLDWTKTPIKSTNQGILWNWVRSRQFIIFNSVEFHFIHPTTVN